MKGHITVDETDFERGAAEGKKNGTLLMFHLTIEIPDMEAFEKDPLRSGECQGWVKSETFGGQRPVEMGAFNLFVDEGPGSKEMRYRLWFSDAAGNPFTLVGFKTVKHDQAFDVWSDTTTLFTHVLSGHRDAASCFPETGSPEDIVASGIIIIWVRDFLRQLTTFRAGGGSMIGRMRALGRFGGIFMRQLAQVYLRKRSK